ncbi:MAG: hypothetical protein L3J76_05980 [Candidatus Hydrothermae bacterium]|nr:hypothetical protein [Candidatus Hydrothermae bacterium]
MIERLINFLATTRLPIPGRDTLIRALQDLQAKRERALRAYEAYRKVVGPNPSIEQLIQEAESELQEKIIGQTNSDQGQEGLEAAWVPFAILGILALGGVGVAVFYINRNAQKWENVMQKVLNDPSLTPQQKQKILATMVGANASGSLLQPILILGLLFTAYKLYSSMEGA